MIVKVRKTERYVVMLMREISMDATLNGYSEIMIGMRLYFDEGFRFSKLSDFYAQIAVRCGKNVVAVEKNIRQAIESAWNGGNGMILYELYGSAIRIGKDKPMAKDFIRCTIAILKERMEERED